jgi:hypothetical protein
MGTSKGNTKTYTKTSRCWPGYEPVPGKSEHEEHSCRKKPASRNGGKQVDRETARKKQIERGGKRAPQAKKKKPLSTAQHRAAVKAGRSSGQGKRVTSKGNKN